MTIHSHAGRTYQITRHRGSVTVTRDDGMIMHDCYPSLRPGPGERWERCWHCTVPALATVAEAKQVIETGRAHHGTLTRRLVWASSPEEASRMLEDDNEQAA